ncbi:MAG: helix-turn-helix domain-containing protein [Planctomycetaceae bacterium]|nr:helix-turn-helix domain-containing protein [Planctomycetaceae bacterium]
MATLAPSLGRIFAERRRSLRLTQARVAGLIGTSQGAVSGFENGNPHALADGKVRELARVLELDLDSLGSETPTGAAGALSFCANGLCPTNDPYLVAGGLKLKPTFAVDPGPFCGCCGEPRAKECQNPMCGAPLREGLCCYRCGQAYVEAPDPARLVPDPLERELEVRRALNRELRGTS